MIALMGDLWEIIGMFMMLDAVPSWSCPPRDIRKKLSPGSVVGVVGVAFDTKEKEISSPYLLKYVVPRCGTASQVRYRPRPLFRSLRTHTYAKCSASTHSVAVHQ